METLKAIKTRRSIRKLAPAPVSKETVTELLDAAMIAPSAGNARPWQFIVVDDKELLNRVPEIHPYAVMTKSASLAILICGDLQAEKYPGNWMLDCAAATQNMLLALHDKGLGGVWCGIWPENDRVDGMRKMLNLPDHVVPLSLVVIGEPQVEAKEASRYEEEKVHWNGW